MGTSITIQDDVCWRCGKPFSKDKGLAKTTHHAIPQQLRPAKNILLPIHEKCHSEITSTDVSSLTAFAYRIHKEVSALKGKTCGLVSLLSNHQRRKKE